MTPAAKLSPIQKRNIGIILQRCVAKGYTGKAAQAAILLITGKECNFIPQVENLNYTAARLLEVFPSKVTTLAQAKALAGKPELIANTIYGGRYGNAANEGFKYRGRGFNQITFKDTYAKIGKLIGVDLVGNPDALNDPKIAADAMLAYFTIRVKLYFPNVDINKVTSVDEALKIFYDANAGAVGKHKKDTTGGYAKAKSAMNEFYELVNNNKAATGGGLFFLILLGVGIAKRKQITEFFTKKKTNETT